MDLIVGNDDCKFVDVMNTMFSSKGANMLRNEGWAKLGIQLGVEEEVNRIRERLYIDHLSPEERVSNLLRAWRSNLGDEATLKDLLRTLRSRRLEFKDMADLLEKKYYSRERSQSEENPVNERNTGAESCAAGAKRKMIRHFRKCLTYYVTESSHSSMKLVAAALLPIFISVFMVVAVRKLFIENKMNPLPDPSPSSTALWSTSTAAYSSYSPIIQYSHSPTSTQFPDPTTTPTDNKTVTVTSVDDYQQQMGIYSIGGMELYINIENSYDWTNATNLVNSHLVTGIRVSGPVHLIDFLYNLKEFPNLRTLHFINTEGGLCEFNQAVTSIPTGMKTVKLSRLKTLTLNYFDSCDKVYRILATVIRSRNLKIFKIKNVILDDGSASWIERILSENSGNLKSLTMKLSRATSTPVPTPILVMKAIKEIFLSVNGNDNEMFPPIYLESRFSSTYENLELFQSENVSIPYHQVDILLECKHLAHLEVTIGFRGNELHTDLEIFKRLPEISVGYIGLQYERCPAQSEIDKLGLNDINSRSGEFFVNTVCGSG